MNSYKLFFIIIVLTISMVSCKKDFLEVPDKTTLLRQAYVTDLKTTGEFLNGIYLMLARDFYYGFNLVYPEIAADNVKPVPNSDNLTSHYTWNQFADNESSTRFAAVHVNMNQSWFTGYKIITSCNFILETIDRYRDQGAEKADDMKGQAYALRALVHFMLTNIFAQSYLFSADGSHIGIPYVTSSEWAGRVERTSVADFYGRVIDDLNNALELLSSNPSGLRYLNRNATKALLSRVYLFQGNYAAAKNMAREVIAVVPIMKTNYPKNLFTSTETEALFQLAPNSDTYFTNFPGMFFTPDYQYRFVATSDIAQLLNENPNDLRKTWVTLTSSDWRITKYPKALVSSYPYGPGSYYQTLIRSSEMYLIAAESYAQLQNDSAIFYLDEIRKRANPSAAPTTAVGAALLDSVYKERRKELAFEGFRMFDMQRLKKNINRIDAPFPAAKSLSYPSNKAIAPIPLSDVTLAGIEQNQDY
jgi:hypothetical protein